jgi:hypothetical protein
MSLKPPLGDLSNQPGYFNNSRAFGDRALFAFELVDDCLERNVVTPTLWVGGVRVCGHLVVRSCFFYQLEGWFQHYCKVRMNPIRRDSLPVDGRALLSVLARVVEEETSRDGIDFDLFCNAYSLNGLDDLTDGVFIHCFPLDHEERVLIFSASPRKAFSDQARLVTDVIDVTVPRIQFDSAFRGCLSIWEHSTESGQQ